MQSCFNLSASITPKRNTCNTEVFEVLLLSEKCLLSLFTAKNSRVYKIFQVKCSTFILRDVSRGQKGVSLSCQIRSDKKWLNQKHCSFFLLVIQCLWYNFESISSWSWHIFWFLKINSAAKKLYLATVATASKFIKDTSKRMFEAVQ